METTPLQRWMRFVDFHAKHWNGIWVRYNPDGSIFEWFPSERILLPSADRLSVSHTNHERRTIGVTTKHWNHEFGARMKQFSFPTTTYCGPNGALLWTTPRFSGLNISNHEFFFRIGASTRCSVTTLYDTEGVLYRVTNIRESEDGVPTPWTEEPDLVPTRKVPAIACGAGFVTDCQAGEEELNSHEIIWPEPLPGRREYFLPDGISVSCPLNITREDEVLIVVDLHLQDGQHHREQLRFPEGWTWPEYTVITYND